MALREYHAWDRVHVLPARGARRVAAAVFAELSGGTIVSAMFTGRKIFDRTPIDVADTPTQPPR